MRALGPAFLISIFASIAVAKVQIPSGLDREDRRETVRILGFGTSSKVLSDPYPLGGYEGFEIGLSVENLPVEDLGRLGNGLSAPQKDIAFPKFSTGKGLYSNFDCFVQFIPYSEKTELSQYGGILRWGAYQAKFLPLNLSILAHFNNANISNLVTTRTIGLDIIGGINVDTVSIFVGGGPVQSRGRFSGYVQDAGSSTPLNDLSSGRILESETVDGFHTVIGANVHVSRTFVAAQIDRYLTTTYSAKLGLRF